jgi:hypothetical protein
MFVFVLNDNKYLGTQAYWSNIYILLQYII